MAKERIIEALRLKVSRDGRFASGAKDCSHSWPRESWMSSLPKPEQPLCSIANFRRCISAENPIRISRRDCLRIQEIASQLPERQLLRDSRIYDREIERPRRQRRELGLLKVLKPLSFTARANKDGKRPEKLAV